jgi:hypothetical protein
MQQLSGVWKIRSRCDPFVEGEKIPERRKRRFDREKVLALSRNLRRKKGSQNGFFSLFFLLCRNPSPRLITDPLSLFDAPLFIIHYVPLSLSLSLSLSLWG